MHKRPLTGIFRSTSLFHSSGIFISRFGQLSAFHSLTGAFTGKGAKRRAPYHKCGLHPVPRDGGASAYLPISFTIFITLNASFGSAKLLRSIFWPGYAVYNSLCVGFSDCFEICDAHFLTCCFPWNSTDCLDGTGRLLCSHLLQSPGLVFNGPNKYYRRDVTSTHPCLPVPAVGTEDTHALQGLLRDAQAPALVVKMQVPLVTMLMQVGCHRLPWDYPLIPAFTRKGISAHRCLCCDSMAASCWSITFVLVQQWCEQFFHILAAFNNCLGTSLLVAQYEWSNGPTQNL